MYSSGCENEGQEYRFLNHSTHIDPLLNKAGKDGMGTSRYCAILTFQYNSYLETIRTWENKDTNALDAPHLRRCDPLGR
jgi:hypothetical protein